ncbi:MAG TPA: hypothetical protein VIP51_14960, partial [Eoetvoesiella sp.]
RRRIPSERDKQRCRDKLLEFHLFLRVSADRQDVPRRIVGSTDIAIVKHTGFARSAQVGH